jgi:arginase
LRVPGDGRLAIIGAPLDLGADRRGVDMGPSAIRYAGLEARLAELGIECVDCGNVELVVPEKVAEGNPRARFLAQIKAACEHVADQVRATRQRGLTPLVLGGDHSVALGTLGGLAADSGPGGVLWLDGHADLNTPANSPSGNVHGMVLGAALGLDREAFASDAWPLPAVDPARTVLLGTRLLDPGEKEAARELGVRVITMSEIDRVGIERAVREALERVAGDGFVHVSLDLDVVDPEEAPGVGTALRGGLSYREAHLAMELVAEAGVMSSLDVVEVNPILDRENQTAALAVELIASAFGARIL